MTTYTAVLDGSKTNVEGHSKFLNRLFGPGVAMALVPTSLQVVQRGAGANMSVDVSVGDCHLQLPSLSYSFWGWADTATNVPLTAADPTNPRTDVIVAWTDTTVTTTASNNSPGSLKFYAMAGTPAGSPVAMSDSAIQAALGPAIAWTKLGTVLVGAAVANVTNANITDARTAITVISPAAANTVPTAAIQDGAVTTAKINDSAITPGKRSGGFKIGTITAATLSTTGNKAITGIGFTPKLVRLQLLPSASTAFMAFSAGTMTPTSQYYTAVAGQSGTVTQARASSTSKALGYINSGGGAVASELAYVSMDADGFTVNVSVAGWVHDVAYEAYA